MVVFSKILSLLVYEMNACTSLGITSFVILNFNTEFPRCKSVMPQCIVTMKILLRRRRCVWCNTEAVTPPQPIP